MVDVISTRLQEVYGSIRIPDFIGLGNNEPEERMTTAQMRRFGDENRRRKLQDKAKERKVGFVTLYNKYAPKSDKYSPKSNYHNLNSEVCAMRKIR